VNKHLLYAIIEAIRNDPEAMTAFKALVDERLIELGLAKPLGGRDEQNEGNTTINT
jgi:hypothetical protein